MSNGLSYVRDGAAIYKRSFAIIRAEADLARFSREQEKVAVRMIHACGMVELAADIAFSPDFVDAATSSPAQGRAHSLRRQYGGAWRDAGAAASG